MFGDGYYNGRDPKNCVGEYLALIDVEQKYALTYTYATNNNSTTFGDIYSNKLLGVVHSQSSNTFTSKDLIPNIGAAGDCSYDDNGNPTINRDKRISGTKFNHLNLPEEISFSTGGKLRFAYDAEENNLTQKVYNSSGALTKTQDHIGCFWTGHWIT